MFYIQCVWCVFSICGIVMLNLNGISIGKVSILYVLCLFICSCLQYLPGEVYQGNLFMSFMATQY